MSSSSGIRRRGGAWEGDEAAFDDSTSAEDEPVGKSWEEYTFLQTYVEQHSSHHSKGDPAKGYVEQHSSHPGPGDVEHHGYAHQEEEPVAKQHRGYYGKSSRVITFLQEYVEHSGTDGKGCRVIKFLQEEEPVAKQRLDASSTDGKGCRVIKFLQEYVEHSGKSSVEHHGKSHVDHNPGYQSKSDAEHTWQGLWRQRGTKSRAGKNVQEKRALLKSAPDTAVAIGKLFRGEATPADMYYLKCVFGQPQVDVLITEAIKTQHKLIRCTGARAVDV
jgi:hypothetical protein